MGGVNEKRVLGLIGSIILLVGIFAPLTNLPPILGGGSYVEVNPSGGVILIILALVSLIMALVKKYKVLWFTGFISLAMSIGVFVSFQVMLSQSRPGLSGLILKFAGLQWGWVLLFVGSALIIVAAALKGTT